MTDEDKTVIAQINAIDLDRNKLPQGNASLVQYSGNALGKRYEMVKERLSIGRSVEADITISEASVSRIHARISQNMNATIIEDAESANGLFINDQKVVAPTELHDQDMLRLGTVILKFFSRDNMDGFVQDKIYRMATIDSGTDIYNKQFLMDALQMQFQQSKASMKPLALIYFDLDHFKKVNDTYGHNAGDQVLRESTALVKKMVRQDDILGRFGGEEFIIILPDTDSQTAFDLADRIRMACEVHVFNLELNQAGIKQVVPHKQTFSVGIAQYTPQMENPKELLEAADQKLYESKQNGRNKVTM
ncbi:MAG: GGDEF domain-containing protein [Zetaproteobacteria bacterium]|nr:GGDEF domain-containing protein [Zetaproteobacteria bacterium]